MSTFKLLELDNCPIYHQLQIEEALLRTDENNWCILNHGSPVSIVLGISGKPELLINPQTISHQKIPLIRRYSGGGTVIVDHNTCFVTWICNADTITVKTFPQPVAQWTEAFYKPLFNGIDFKLIENDYVIGNRKCGGNAQYFAKNRWVHHTTFLWDFDEENMNHLLVPAKVPGYRHSRSHSDFLCTLKDHFPEQKAFLELIKDQLSSIFEIKKVSENSVKEFLLKPHRKTTQIL